MRALLWTAGCRRVGMWIVMMACRSPVARTARRSGPHSAGIVWRVFPAHGRLLPVTSVLGWGIAKTEPAGEILHGRTGRGRRGYGCGRWAHILCGGRGRSADASSLAAHLGDGRTVALAFRALAHRARGRRAPTTLTAVGPLRVVCTSSNSALIWAVWAAPKELKQCLWGPRRLLRLV